jgi:hypothetical protein
LCDCRRTLETWEARFKAGNYLDRWHFSLGVLVRASMLEWTCLYPRIPAEFRDLFRHPELPPFGAPPPPDSALFFSRFGG